jgi:hypothetical protein
MILMCPNVNSAWAQNDSVTVEKVSIINAKHKVDGIYKTFDEFRENIPFYTGEFEVIGSKVNYEDTVYPINQLSVADFQDHVKYDGNTESSRTGRFESEERFWGFYKNDTLYFGFWKYHPVILLGHLSLIYVQEYTYDMGSPNMISFGNFAPGGRIAKDVAKYFVLDFLTGKIEPINTVSLKNNIQAYDQMLFNEYKKAKRKRSLKVQIEYLKKFNKRNPIRF